MSPDYKTSPKGKTKKTDDHGEICRTALARYQRFLERERENIAHAYEDLEFCWDDKQWSDSDRDQRKDRPTLTVNRLPQFVHQVTGDMRQMKPAIRVVAVDSAGDKDTAETIAGMVRYIENRSDAPSIYTSGADHQVSCGIGAWRVTKEYAAESTFNQEIRIVGVDDPVAIAWDPDAVLPTREDAKWCIVPVDMSRESFKEQYPDASIEDFDDAKDATITGWFDQDFVRVAEYWVKKPVKRKLALLPDGAIQDLTDSPEVPPGARIEERDGFKVCRYLITAAHVLEGPIDWPGMYIPIIPVVGEEVRIGRRVVRRGLVRSAKDPQRMFNYFCSAQAEVTALQPKAPFMVTEKNIEKYQDSWAEANTKALPYLPYEPDPKNGGVAPQRVPPPVSSQGITEGITLAAENMKAVIGIYDASLGQKSNETSGVAIRARQREGDVGSYVYIDNWSRAIRHTGMVAIDLIPHVYDSERMIRIMGEDGKVDLKWINRPVGLIEMDEETGEPSEVERVENDVTVGAYDVVLETGPSYSTKREEAKEGMISFIQSAPEMAPVIMDLVAKAQDWPLADQIAERLEAVAPPQVQKLLANQKKEQGDEVPPSEPPSPAEQMQMAGMQADVEGKHLANEKLKVEIAVAARGEAPDQSAAIKAQAEALKLQNDARRADMEHQAALQEMEIKRRLAAVDLEMKLTDLAIKKQGLQIDTVESALNLQNKHMSMVHEAERHTAGLVQGMEKHQTSIQQGAESHAAKVNQMKKQPERPSAS